jgi:heme-degrading monooxygenase HmoA
MPARGVSSARNRRVRVNDDDDGDAVSLDTRRTPMPEIRENHDIVTQITTVKTTPDNQSDVLELMTERARFMATQPGFVSISLHRSEDGSHIVNYVQWTSRNKLEAAHHSPEFRKKWPRFGELVKEAEPCLYQVVHIEAA